jgi:GNAT superfamily N-acetyltransferase
MQGEIPGHHREELPDQGETTNSPEQFGESLIVDAIISILRDLKSRGADFEEEDLEHIRVMPTDEALQYLLRILDDVDIEDKEGFLREKGLGERVPSDLEDAVEHKAEYTVQAERILTKERMKEIHLITFRNMKKFADVVEQTQMTPVMAEDWPSRIAEEMMHLVVAYEGKTPVGRVGIYWTGPDEPAVAEKLGPVPMINALKVNEEYRGGGLGLRLMLYCEIELKDQIKDVDPKTIPALALLVKPHNEPALNLYKNLGYEFVDEELYEASLPDPATGNPVYGRLMMKKFDFNAPQES